MGIRRRAREAALQMLYQIDASEVSAEDAIRLFWSSLGEGMDPSVTESVQASRDFANMLVRGWAERRDEIDELIKQGSQNWRLERMSRVDRNVLRLGVLEILALDDVPRKVTLNEAIELAKKFGAEGSASFVNGVLDRIATERGKE
jgi:N utilization substance protein B